MTNKSRADIQLRIRLDGEIAIGPGKADLLDGISETGSIAAAGRRMNMSYKRAWLLVETMNRCFINPVVETRRGGSTKGGAVLTDTGRAVLSAYRRVVAATDAALDDDGGRLRGLLADTVRACPEDRSQD